MEGNLGIRSDLPGYFYFQCVFLPIRKTHSLDMREMLFGPKQTSGRILSAGKAYHCSFFFLHKILVFNTWFSKHTEKKTILFGGQRYKVLGNNAG